MASRSYHKKYRNSYFKFAYYGMVFVSSYSLQIYIFLGPSDFADPVDLFLLIAPHMPLLFSSAAYNLLEGVNSFLPLPDIDAKFGNKISTMLGVAGWVGFILFLAAIYGLVAALDKFFDL